MGPIRLPLFHIFTLCSFVLRANCCDLEQLFGEKQVSVEESTAECDVVFRGVDVPSVPLTTTANEPDADGEGEVLVNFDLVNTYKGAEVLSKLGTTTSYRV
nr:unnamed protein product [Callosobruchus chinensis]